MKVACSPERPFPRWAAATAVARTIFIALARVGVSQRDAAHALDAAGAATPRTLTATVSDVDDAPLVLGRGHAPHHGADPPPLAVRPPLAGGSAADPTQTPDR